MDDVVFGVDGVEYVVEIYVVLLVVIDYEGVVEKVYL